MAKLVFKTGYQNFGESLFEKHFHNNLLFYAVFVANANSLRMSAQLHIWVVKKEG